MSFNYGNSSRRHKSSGRHFKLFSDELPQIEFDKAAMEEYSAKINENRRTRGRRRTFRESNQDRVSLPSLGTPDWDKLSDIEKGRPASHSPFNPLNPNFSKIHQKIQRRHTLKETKVNDWSKRNHSQGHIVKNGFSESQVDKNQYISAWQEIAQKSLTQVDVSSGPISDKNDEEQIKTIERSESIKRVIEKPPTPKKKSVLKELLDAASKETNRMNQIKEGLNFNDEYLRRNYNLRALPQNHSKIVADHNINAAQVTRRPEHVNNLGNEDENIVPEVISEPGNTKPGILKHGARVRDSHMFIAQTKPAVPVKPRLVHHDDLPQFGKEKLANQNADEVKVSVHTAAPMNRVEDLVFVPLPSNKGNGKQKRVNFNEKIDVKEKTAVSDLLELNDDDPSEHEPLSKESNSKITYTVETVKAKDESNDENVCPRVGSTQIRRRVNVKHKEIPKTKQYVSIARRHPSIDSSDGHKSTIVPRVTKHSAISKDYIDTIFSSKIQTKKSTDLRMDPAWKEAKTEINNEDTALNDTPATSDVKVEESDNVTSVKGTDKNSKTSISSPSPEGRSDSRSMSNIPVLNIPEIQEFFRNGGGTSSPNRSPPRSPIRSPPKTPDIDFESLSEFTALFGDEFDISLPDEIDRSMLGEDLIKAYRFWDRKKKAFPGGLRKIEAPIDRSDGFYPKEYGNVKTYKIGNPRLERPPLVPTSNRKTTVNGVSADWV